MKKLAFTSMFLSALVLLASCGSADNDTKRITITGSSTIAPLMSEIVKLYEKKHPDLRVEVQSGGSSKGLMDVRQNMADIGMVSRKLKSTESDVTAIKIAIDGLSIIVHKDNPIQQITSRQVIDIYSGKYSNWSELGGEDIPITVVSKAEGRSTLEIFSKHFDLAYKEIQADVIIGDNQQGIMTVNGNPGAIAYVSIGAAEHESVYSGAKIKLLTLDGIEATTENVSNSSYPITRELNLVVKGKVSQDIVELIEFATSPQVEHIYVAQSFIVWRPEVFAQTVVKN